MRVRASGFGWSPVPHRPLCAAFSWIPPAAFITPAADSLTCLSVPNEVFLEKNCAAFLFYFFLFLTHFLSFSLSNCPQAICYPCFGCRTGQVQLTHTCLVAVNRTALETAKQGLSKWAKSIQIETEDFLMHKEQQLFISWAAFISPTAICPSKECLSDCWQPV